MPKWGIHQIVLDEAIGRLAASGAENLATAQTLTNQRHLSMLGAVGPDLFFFSPDYEIVDRLFQLYKNIDGIVDIYNDAIQPLRDIRDAVVEPIEDAVETLAPATVDIIRQAVERLRDTAGLFQSTMATGLFAGVVSGFNFITDTANLPSVSTSLFQFFIPGVQRGEPESLWYWFDMLHYRSTGEFARNLVRLAEESGSEAQRAYAYGYLSHIATDLVGHPFVNQVVGGPYRLHAQRHVVAENFMDTWKIFNHDGTSVNQTLFNKLSFPEEFEPLPDEIVTLLQEAFRQTYTDPASRPMRVNADAGPDAGFLSRQQIADTYEITYRVQKMFQKMAVKRPEEPFSGVAETLEEALRDIFEAPPAPPSPSGGGACSFGDIMSFGLTASSRDCYSNFFENLEDWFEYFGELLRWAVETLLDIVDLILATLLALPITVLLALLYGIQLLMYELYQTMRHLLVIEGFLTPEPADLESSHGRNLTTTFQCGVTPFRYPQLGELTRSHLVCAIPTLETPNTAADFYDSSNLVTPDDFITNRPFDIKALFRYAASPNPQNTRELERGEFKIGNAADLTAWMIGNAANPVAGDGTQQVVFTNWNLDGDRGYGYKTWEGQLSQTPNGAMVSEEVFVMD